LFAPRSLLLVLPWIIFAVFNTNPAYWILGNHYIFPATAALFIAFTFGLDRLHRWAAEDASPFRKGASTPARLSEGRPADAPSARGSSTRAWTLDGGTRTGSSGPATLLSIGVVIIIAGNLFLNPLNPLTATLVPELGKPFPVSYGVNLGPLPNGQPLERLISMIPKNAIVTAPLPVYSLVSDDPYAYPMADFTNPPFNDFLLPGNESTRVAYVLLPYNTPEYDFTPALLATLYDRSDFGVRGCVSESAAGGVELFQRNYNGTPVVFGPPDSLCPNYYSGGAGLTAGPHSSVVNNASSPSGVVVRSAPCHSNSTVWSGPGIELPAGQYGLHVVFNGYNGTSVSCLGNGFEPARALLALSVTGQNATNPVPAQLYYHRLTESSVCSHTCGSWTFWNLTITLNSATSDLSVVGTVLIGQYIVQVSYVVISTGPIVKF
jgi:hypothetical protein